MENNGNNDLLVIRKHDPNFPEHLDFDTLRREGIAHISEMSGKIWTDQNLHDPGITILEMLCYALLDLGYRATLPIEDILAIDPDSGRLEDNFFTPGQILSCNPTTILDYRKLLIDIEGVRNAWLEIADDVLLYVNCDKTHSNTPGSNFQQVLSCTPPHAQKSCKVPLNGLYRVYIELDEVSLFCGDSTAGPDPQKIIREVKSRLCRHRNLCEDFIEVCILCKSEMGLCANIDLDHSADPEKVYTEIITAVAGFLDPAPRFYTLQEMLEKGKSTAEIFEGRPYTLNSFGFTDSDELAKIQLKKEIHLSDIYQLIMNIPGVRSVRGLKLTAADVPPSAVADNVCLDWKWHLSRHHIPALCVDKSCLNMFKGGATFNISKERARILLLQSLSNARKVAYTDGKYLDLPVPQGRFRPDLGEYYSIQNEFPKVYGIAQGGLPESASVERKAQARQLQGYLLFYDRLLSGWLAQISHTRDLFSWVPDSRRDANVCHTYFSQNPDTVPYLNKLIKNYNDNSPGKGFVEADQGILESETEYIQRRNAFLDHLLARFAESFTDLSVALYNSDAALLEAKGQFLATYPELSRNRGRGFNYCNPEADPILQISGLEARIAGLAGFGIEGPPKLCYFEVRKKGQAWQINLTEAGGKPGFYSITEYSTQQKAEQASLAMMGALQNPANYQQVRNCNSGSNSLYLTYPDGIAQWRRDFPSEVSAADKAETLLNYFSPVPRESNVFISANTFQLFLHNRDSRPVAKSKKEFPSEKKALEGIAAFAAQIDKQLPPEAGQTIPNLKLVNAPASSSAFIDLNAFEKNRKVNQCGFQWCLQNENGQALVYSETVFPTEAQGAQAFTAALSHKLTVLPYEDSDIFGIQVLAGNALIASGFFQDEKTRNEAVISLEAYLQAESQNGVFLSVFSNPFQWELCDEDGWEILKSTRYFRKKTAAANDWQELKKRKITRGDFIVVELGEHQYYISLHDEYNLGVAASPVLDKSFQEPEALIKAIIKAFKNKDSLRVTQPESGWGFQLPAAGGEIALTSYHLFPSSFDAWLALERFLPMAARKKFYHKTDDKVNSDFSFLVQDENNRLIAFHPNFYDTASDRDARMDETAATLKDFSLPLQYQQKFTYQYLDKRESVLLQSEIMFNSEQEATEAFFQLIPLFSLHQSFEICRVKGRYKLNVIQNQETAATHPDLYATAEDAQAEVTCLQEAAAQNTYSIQAFEVPKAWKYRFSADTLSGKTEVIFESRLAFGNKAEADSAYASFMLKMPELKIRQVKSAKGVGFALFAPKSKEAEAVHPHTYIDVKDQTTAKEALQNAVTYTAAQQAAIHQNIPSQAFSAQQTQQSQGGDFSYSLNGKGGLLAYHPCRCFKDPSDLELETLLNNLLAAVQTPGVYSHLEICLAADAIEKTGLQYFYQIKDHHTGQLYFTSYQGYDTQALALDALQREYLWVIALASDPASYPPAGSKDTYPISATAPPLPDKNRQPLAEAPLVYLSDPAITTSDYARLAELFKRYPIRQVQNRGSDALCGELPTYSYCFQLIRDHRQQTHVAAFTAQKCPEDWKSSRCYETPEKAWQAYRKFRALLRNKDNFTLYFDEKKCCYFLAVQETLLVSVDRYATAIGAWGEPLMLSEEVYATRDEACRQLELFNKGRIVRNETMGVSGSGNCVLYNFAFELAVPGSQQVITFHSENFADLDEANRLSLEYTMLAREGGRICVVKDEDCNYRLALSDPGNRKKTTHSSGQNILAKTRQTFHNETEAKAFIQDFLNGIQSITCVVAERTQGSGQYYIQVTKNGQLFFLGTETYSSIQQAEAVCNRVAVLFQESPGQAVIPHLESPGVYTAVIVEQVSAPGGGAADPCVKPDCLCSSGLEHLLDIASMDGAFYPYYDPATCCYSFYIVDASFRLARHPHTYATPEERDKALAVWTALCRQKKALEWKIDWRGQPVGYEYKITVGGVSGIVWEGVSKSELPSAQASEQTQFEVLAFAKDPLFYCVDTANNQVQLCRKIKPAGAVSCADEHVIAVHKGGLSVDKLVELSKLYPFVKTENGYCVQIYCPDFTTPETLPDDSEPCTLCAGEAVTKPLFLQPKGAVVWESTRCYNTIEEARCAYELMCRLQMDPDSVRRTGDLCCADYSFELVNPEGIVATHPQCQRNKEELEAAMQRTRDGMNVEGMHLLEHILLRPRSIDKRKCEPAINGSDCDCLLQATPDCDCAFALDEVGQVRDKDNPADDVLAGDPICGYIPGADPYSFWATVVLPCWPKRFRQANFREFFQELVLRETPAHIALNFEWISPAQMCRFETKHRRWRDWLAGKETCSGNTGNPQKELIQCITNFKGCCAEKDETVTPECNCDKKAVLANSIVEISRRFRVQKVPVAIKGAMAAQPKKSQGKTKKKG